MGIEFPKFYKRDEGSEMHFVCVGNYPKINLFHGFSHGTISMKFGSNCEARVVNFLPKISSPRYYHDEIASNWQACNLRRVIDDAKNSITNEREPDRARVGAIIHVLRHPLRFVPRSEELAYKVTNSRFPPKEGAN